MNIRLHPCSQYRPERAYRGETCFELDKWCHVLKDITENAKPIDKPVQIHWTSGDYELRGVPGAVPEAGLGRVNGDFDPDCTWLVEAWVVKALKFHEDDWHPERIAFSKAISAYFSQLPDDWPVIVHYV